MPALENPEGKVHFINMTHFPLSLKCGVLDYQHLEDILPI